MGVGLFDQYSLLHVAVAIIAYFWQVPFWLGLLVHTGFELFENSTVGVGLINRFFVGTGPLKWPGRKDSVDTVTNQVGDSIAFAIGWLFAYGVDWLGRVRGWHKQTIVPL